MLACLSALLGGPAGYRERLCANYVNRRTQNILRAISPYNPPDRPVKRSMLTMQNVLMKLQHFRTCGIVQKFDCGHQFGSVRLGCDAEVVQLRLVHSLERLEVLVPIQDEDRNVILK